VNFLARDREAFKARLASSGAQIALVVSNEEGGILKEMADWSLTFIPAMARPFHVPIPDAQLLRKVPFSAQLCSSDFRVMATHFVRILLDVSADPMLIDATEKKLRELLTSPKTEIAQAIYGYRLVDKQRPTLRHTGRESSDRRARSPKTPPP
jgi:hypothetical protein